MKTTIIPHLKYGSTWKLLGLGIITYGVYWAHYIKSQSSAINQHCDENKKIPDSFVSFIMVISYISLALFFPYLFVEESHPIAALSNLADFVWTIVFIVWAFKARNRMNVILSAQKKQIEWFHGLWTFLFTVLYFNFKVNKLSETVDPSGVVNDEATPHRD